MTKQRKKGTPPLLCRDCGGTEEPGMPCVRCEEQWNEERARVEREGEVAYFVTRRCTVLESTYVHAPPGTDPAQLMERAIENGHWTFVEHIDDSDYAVCGPDNAIRSVPADEERAFRTCACGTDREWMGDTARTYACPRCEPEHRAEENGR